MNRKSRTVWLIVFAAMFMTFIYLFVGDLMHETPIIIDVITLAGVVSSVLIGLFVSKLIGRKS